MMYFALWTLAREEMSWLLSRDRAISLVDIDLAAAKLLLHGLDAHVCVFLWLSSRRMSLRNRSLTTALAH